MSWLLAPPVWVLAAVLVMMAVEANVSQRHERHLRARGAFEPADDVYATMRWAYPTAFLVMTAEGVLLNHGSSVTLFAGAGLFAVSKALKAWAIRSLGVRWTFRVLVPPRDSLVTAGPYAWMRHPNYVAVIGELAGAALMTGAWMSGPVATLLFGLLMRQRIRVEDAALGRRPASAGPG